METNLANAVQVFETFKSQFAWQDCFCENVSIRINKGLLESETREYDLVVFSPTKIIFFTSLPDSVSESNACYVLRSSLNALSAKLSVDFSQIIACGFNVSHFCYLNIFNDRVRMFDQTKDGVRRFLGYIQDMFSQTDPEFELSQLRGFVDTLTQNDVKEGKPKERVREDEEGRLLVYKHGTWYEASDIDPDSLIFSCALLGMFGTHRFLIGQKLKGLLYLLTGGLCGVGWFFDTLEILFGIFKDKDGRYLIPMENKKRGWLLLLGGVAVFALYVFIITTVFNFAIHLFFPK